MKHFRATDPFADVARYRRFTFGANAWPSNNRGILVPVVFPAASVLYSVGFVVTTSSGNYDLAFYDPNLKRLASAGSTAVPGAQAVTLSLSNIHVTAGLTYFAGLALSTTACSIAAFGTSDAGLRHIVARGIAQQASALPLPDPFVPATPASDFIPLIFFGVR